MTFRRVAVIGVGNIGSGVMADLVLHGLSAVGVEASAASSDAGRAAVLKAVRFAPLLNPRAAKLSRDEVLGRATFTTSLEEVAGCDFVIENVTEDWSVKEPLYRRLDRIADPAVCFGANTSCIPIGRIGAATGRPDKVVGMHLMNPVHLKPAVEVIRSGQTSAATLAAVDALFAQLGKHAIVVGDLPGFVSNRISHLFMNEAAAVLADGIATAEQIDAIFRECFGHRMGPLATADLIGLDTVVRSLDVLFASYQDPKYQACPLLRRLVAAGDCGVKSGRGFFRYPTS
ncbi:MAG TPA: 3-hydroxyacyl-CoA dehydrogenase family protein [Opitutaceae bacterium]|jgi:3-hydroxybutyryl-CoA dehydrogenase|nr:3-hydroxyacyl-CoA dehydrogenase family protein [Opitutaceae bacterium]